MAHHTLRSGYESLVERLNRLPQGAPPSDTLYAILKLLFTEKEAGLVALLPIRPFTAAHAARVWKMGEGEAQKILDELAGRAILLDAIAPDGATSYILPPPMAGFFEFSMMRLRGDVDQKLLAQLFYQYINVEEDFITALFMSDTRLGRAFVDEDALLPEQALTVLDYERASEVMRTASARSDRRLLLPPQNAAHGSRLRRAHGDLYDLQHHGRRARAAWLCARGRRHGGPRFAPGGA